MVALFETAGDGERVAHGRLRKKSNFAPQPLRGPCSTMWANRRVGQPAGKNSEICGGYPPYPKMS